VEEIKGTQVRASRDSKIRVRNMAKVKLLRPRPQHLLPSKLTPQAAQESSDEDDWLDFFPSQDE
jgi:hypothetical protein